MLNNILRLRKEFLEISSLTSYAYWIRHVNILSYICSSLELLAISKIVVSRHTNREWNMGVRWYGITLQLFNANEWGVEVQRMSEVSRCSERVRCRVEHENWNFICTSNHVLFCLSYKHNSPLLKRKVNFIDEWK